MKARLSKESLKKSSSPAMRASGMPLADIKKMKGDILSNMMALSEHQPRNFGAASPQSLTDVIKNTAKQLTHDHE